MFSQLSGNPRLDCFYDFKSGLLETLSDLPEIAVLAKSIEDAKTDFFVQFRYATPAATYIDPKIILGTTHLSNPYLPFEQLAGGLDVSTFKAVPTTTVTAGGIGKVTEQAGFLGSSYSPSWTKFLKMTQHRVSGFDTSPPADFKAIKLDAVPKFPNVPHWAGYVVPVSSKVHLRLFSTFQRFIDVDWAKQRAATTAKWMFQDGKLKDLSNVAAISKAIVADFHTTIHDYLLHRFGLAAPFATAGDGGGPGSEDAGNAETSGPE